MAAIIQVQTTTATLDDALHIARELVGQKLAACVQVLGPISSTYRWQGAVETAEEWLCVVKTRAALYAQVEGEIRRLHKYETPEILAVPVEHVHEAYRTWLESET
jgi:periplasmic divalent cation tolerance protein